MVTKSLSFSLSPNPLCLCLFLFLLSISPSTAMFSLCSLWFLFICGLYCCLPPSPYIPLLLPTLVSTGLLFVVFKFTKTGTRLASPIQCRAVLLSQVLILGHFKAGYQCVCVLDVCSHTERGGIAQSKSTIPKQLCSEASSQSHKQRHGGRKEVCLEGQVAWPCWKVNREYLGMRLAWAWWGGSSGLEHSKDESQSTNSDMQAYHISACT